MLHFIDVSNWQKGMTLPESKIDACIVKATEGTNFVDKFCDGFVQQCKRKGILYGFYHFMSSAKPEEQALFFAKNTIGYSLEGIPVLDVESELIPDWGEYAQRFVDKYHAITGVYPIIYTSAAYLSRFNGYPLVDTCGLWLAGYPDSRERGLNDIPKFPYDVSPWKFAAMWQYTSNGIVDWWDAPIDLDVAWMDTGAWKLYANPNATPIDETMQMPPIIPAPNTDGKRWHFENGVVEVDVKLK